MLVTSVMDPAHIFSNGGSLFPTSIYIGNIIKVLVETPIPRYLFNTVVVSGSIVLLQVVTSSLAAYAFSFMEFKGKNLLFILAISTMMVPGEATIISNYLTVSSWRWLDTYKVLIIPFTASAMGIFLMRQFYMTFAKEIKEAAQMDGCSHFRFLIQIAIPLSKPAVGAFGIYSFLNAWNMYMWPLLVTNSDAKRTVQIGINRLKDADATQSLGFILAGVVIVTLPSLLVFIIGQKQLVDGMTAGAVKE
jgi:sn-glycerol 3-phosphate transport system permease protein